MIKQKHHLRIIMIFGGCVIAALLFVYLSIVFVNKPDKFYHRKVYINTSSEMTVQERIEDFNLICQQIESSVPMLYDYETLYGISYNDTKEYYAYIVKTTNSDFEYYAVLSGFFNNIPSIHMSLGFPSVSYIDDEFRTALQTNKSFVKAQDYWYNVIKKECQKYYNDEINKTVFAYYSGKYMGIDDSTESILNKAELISVNGMSVDDFIKMQPMPFKLKYDFVNEKAMRDMIVFNDKVGEKCVIEYLDEHSSKHSVETYYSAESTIMLNYIDYFKGIDGIHIQQENAGNVVNSKKNYTAIGDIIVIKDEDNNFLYISIDGFTNEKSNGDLIAATIKNSSDGIDNIIIDLRNNNGGYYEYAYKLLSAVSDKSFEISDDVFITDESYNRNKNKSLYKLDNTTGLYKAAEKMCINGEMNSDKNVFLIISDYTASSADMVASEFKRNNLGLIIGTNNTSGEKNGTLCLNYSDISGIYYTYTEYSSYNSDGTINSVYGTAPDIYLNTNIENYFIREEIIQNGEDPYDFENRLKWDSVLYDVLEIVNEKENAEWNTIA